MVKSLPIVLVVLHGADGADLRILAAQVPIRVEHGVDVQTRRRRATGELAETQDELLLQVVCEVVLGTEEDYTSLRDYIGGDEKVNNCRCDVSAAARSVADGYSSRGRKERMKTYW